MRSFLGRISNAQADSRNIKKISQDILLTCLADSPYIHSCFNLSTTATSRQWQLSSVPKVAVVERFNCSKLQRDEKRYPTFEQPRPEVPYSLKAVARVASVSA